MTAVKDPVGTPVGPGSSEARQRLAKLLADRGRGPRLYPLSFSQQRLW